MWKKILIALSILFALLIGATSYGIHYFNTFWFKEQPNYLKLNKDSIAFDFHFAAGKYGELIEPHALIKVPIRLPGIPQRFYLQWDTGSPHSLIYRNPIEALGEQGYNWEEANGFLLDFEIEMGKGILSADSFPIFENYGRKFELADSLTPIKLGTLGADVMDKKISIIDFKNGRMEIRSKRPKWMDQELSFKPFQFAGRRMMLPAILEGQEHDLFYDSGSSAFGLITTRGRFEDYSDESSPLIRYDANSWGNSVPICHKETELKMQMGGQHLPLGRVSYIDMYTPIQGILAPFSAIGGWLGNKAFLDCKLILDCQTEEFIVLK